MNEAMTELRSRLKTAYNTIKADQRDLACDLIARLGSHFVWALKEDDFMGCFEIGWANDLLPHLADFISGFVAHLEPSQLNGISADFCRDALQCMIPHWFQRHAFPCQTDGWTLPASVTIGCAINDRRKEIVETQRVRDFYAKLGKPTDPSQRDNRQSRSPTTALEERADIPPDVKMNVLRNYLEVRNRDGITTPDDVFRTGFLKYHARSLEAARRLFAANPGLSAYDLIGIVGACCEILEESLPAKDEENRSKHLRQCWNLSYLLLMLRQVIKESGFDVPVQEYLTKPQLFGSQAAEESDPA